jgi:hypothetical protein
MSKPMMFGAIALAVLVAGLLGLGYGRSTTSVARDELEATRLRLQLVEARAQVLDARVSLYLVNFGDAGRHLAYAKTALGPARASLTGARRPEVASTLDRAVKEIDAAQEQASRLNQDANSRAAEAARLLDQVIQATGKR